MIEYLQVDEFCIAVKIFKNTLMGSRCAYCKQQYSNILLFHQYHRQCLLVLQS